MYNNLTMPKSRQMIKITKLLAVIGFISLISAYAWAEDKQPKPANTEKFTRQEEEKFTELEKTARGYRDQGLTAQNAGDIETAMKFYQKAIELDPYYAAPYNDLGVIYEAAGSIDNAEKSYIKTIEIDANYSSAYTNLALLYEGKRDLKKAVYYWQKRAQLGAPDDPWTQKANQRVEDMRVVLSATPIKDAREQEILGLTKDIANNKDLLNQDNGFLAKDHFRKAKKHYDKGDLAGAFQEALDAQYLDPDNKEIETFIDKVQARVLSK